MGLKFNDLSETLKQRIRRDNPTVFGPNSSGLCPDHKEPVKRNTLVRPLPRKDKGRISTLGRARIRFTIYSVRPADWDGYDVKALQDMLVRTTLLFADDWCFLQGEVVSEKAYSKAEEKTVIEIFT